jgi:hypothetical protein
VFLLGSLFAILVGLACLAGGVKAVVTRRRKRAAAVSASGVVVDLQMRVFRAGSSGVYCPVVEFATGTGAVVRFESSFGTMPASHAVGQAVQVLYDPASPETAEVDSGLSSWLTTGCLFAFGALGLFFGLVFAGLHVLLSASR